MFRPSLWLKSLTRPCRPTRRRPSARLRLEGLEDRDVPAVIHFLISHESEQWPGRFARHDPQHG